MIDTDARREYMNTSSGNSCASEEDSLMIWRTMHR